MPAAPILFAPASTAKPRREAGSLIRRYWIEPPPRYASPMMNSAPVEWNSSDGKAACEQSGVWRPGRFFAVGGQGLLGVLNFGERFADAFAGHNQAVAERALRIGGFQIIDPRIQQRVRLSKAALCVRKKVPRHGPTCLTRKSIPPCLRPA